MSKIDPELWILVHGGVEPEAVAEWAPGPLWAWFAALLDRAVRVGRQYSGVVTARTLKLWMKEAFAAGVPDSGESRAYLRRVLEVIAGTSSWGYAFSNVLPWLTSPKGERLRYTVGVLWEEAQLHGLIPAFDESIAEFTDEVVQWMERLGVLEGDDE